ncbi:MAG: hypothetical protein A2074_05135 [Candidatus Aquicultor primus]|uniref:Segregation and condensation protein A n=1 Tax=Candidatus Aquicultor primus TaxID=1797195 RepID=A0A1F2USG6_9ACTN|nr:MAG: hypothetical protein A2074_05135 [Candidatus Aquicultor primus]HCG99322.1 segregation/condensation protein A [Actinomycetota bacterium]
MAYQIKSEMYEGPFDLLLSLVSRQKIDIYDISLAGIADEYLEYIDSIQDLDLDISTEFLLVAATLLEIKAASLLPKKEEAYEEDEISPHEAREILIARLLEYKKFKNVAAELAARHEAESKYHLRDVGVEEEFKNLIPDFLAGVSRERMRKLFLAINDKKEIGLTQADHITPKPLSVEAFIDRVKLKLRGVKSTSFRDLTADCTEKVELITAFLAVLELYKQGIVDIGQAETFGDIMVIVADKSGVIA